MSYQPKFATGERHSIGPHYWLDDPSGGRALYSYIRKNACSSFKGAIARQACENSKWDPRSASVKARNVTQVPTRDEYEKTVFVYRDPFKRIVSLYINKFVNAIGHEGVFKSYKNLMGSDPSKASLKEVLCYAALEDKKIDPHFWVQKSHLMPITYSHPIDFNHFQADLYEIFGEGADSLFPRHNMTRYVSNDAGDLSSTPANIIRQRNGCDLMNFETPEVRSCVRKKYAADYEMIAEIKGETYSAAC